MKTKKINKKLTLNKKTLTHLQNGEMKTAKGGVPPFLDPQGGDNQTVLTQCP